MRILGAMVFVAVAVGATQAEDTIDRSLRQCAAKVDSVERLSCFDAAVAPLVQAANKAATAPPAADVGAWENVTEASAIDDSTTVLLTVAAKDPYPDDYQMRKPTLHIRCMQNVTSLYVNFDGDYMSDVAGRGSITMRVDKSPATKHSMDVSTNNESLGLWTGGQAIPVIKRLMAGDVLLVQAIPVSASPVLVEFPIHGLGAVIGPLRAACKW